MNDFIEYYSDHVRVREATKQGYAIAIGGDSINLEQPNSKTRRGRVGHQIANTLTTSCNQGVVIDMNTNKIIREIIPQQVRVRKYEVNIDKLKEVLRNAKKICGLTNGEISNQLNKPKTLVEHWFRNDNCFSIPDEDIWFDLKKLLKIHANEFDKSITTFEIRDGVYDKSNRVYDSSGIAPTLTCASAENERYMVDEYNHLYGLNKLINKGVDNMWNNNLEKLNFEVEEIRIFDIFAGIGALHQSLKELGVPVRVTNLSEVDIDATISYAAGHIDNFKDLEFEYPSVEEMRQWLIDRNIGYSFEKNKSSVPRMKVEKLKLAYKANVLLNNLGDISKIDYDKIEDFDLMNMSFPCTDLSNAGQQRGMRNEDGTPTRSGLYVYSIKAVRAKKPKYVMIENVKALIQKKFIEDFYSVINELEECGYNCYYPTKEDKKRNKVPTCLNSKDFGIPQNRERIFVIAIRKDIDTKTFEFPVGKDYGIRLKDVLEDQVDEKYYLSEEIQKRFKLNGKSDDNRNELNVVGSSAPECRTIGQRDITYGVNGVMSTLTATDYKQPKQILDIQNGAIRGRYNSEGKIEQQLELRNDGVTNTLTTVEKDNVIIEDTSYVNRIGGCFDTERSTHQAGSVYDNECLSPTLDTMQGGYRQPCIKVLGKLEGEGWHDIETRVHDCGGISPTIETRNRGKYMDGDNFRIRKLTPLECWRLMGFRDEAFHKAQELGVSDSQLYKQAGNSIVVNCLYYIFKNLFKEYIK